MVLLLSARCSVISLPQVGTRHYMDLLPHSTGCLDLRFYSDFCLAESVETGHSPPFVAVSRKIIHNGRRLGGEGGYLKARWLEFEMIVSFLHSFWNPNKRTYKKQIP